MRVARCKGCNKPLYAVNCRCLMCGHYNGTKVFSKRNFNTRWGAMRLARREGREAMVLKAIARREATNTKAKERANRQYAGAAWPPTAPPAPTGWMPDPLAWQAAEREARDWMRQHGWPGAVLTASGADGGVDVRAPGAPGAVAQVKLWKGPVGVGDVQRLYACAAAEQARPLFFAAAGYTKKAAEWADTYGVLRFSVSPVQPQNIHAQAWVAGFAEENKGRPRPSAGPTNMAFTEADAETTAAFWARVEVLRKGPPWNDRERTRRQQADAAYTFFERWFGKRDSASARRNRLSHLGTEAKAARRRP